MPTPRWIKFLVYGRRPETVRRAVPPAEFDAWKRQQQKRFIEDADRVRGTVQETRMIVLSLRGPADDEPHGVTEEKRS